VEQVPRHVHGVALKDRTGPRPWFKLNWILKIVREVVSKKRYEGTCFLETMKLQPRSCWPCGFPFPTVCSIKHVPRSLSIAQYCFSFGKASKNGS
jgi:hypothetical protein